MKQLQLLATLILLFIVVFFGCKKENDSSGLPTSNIEITSITGKQVYLKNKSSNYDKIIWDFGDSTDSTINKSDGMVSISHTYADAGSYIVKLTAINSAGNNSSSKTITISNIAEDTFAEITDISNVLSTSGKMVFTLTKGASTMVANYYLQLSLMEDFSVLEDANYWDLYHQDELDITGLLNSELKNLIPE